MGNAYFHNRHLKPAWWILSQGNKTQCTLMDSQLYEAHSLSQIHTFNLNCSLLLALFLRSFNTVIGLRWNGLNTQHPFNGPFSGTTQVSRYQKGKTNLDFAEARDSEWQWHQLGHMQVCNSLQTDNHASTPPLSFFTGWMPFLPPNQQQRSTEGLKDKDIGKLQFNS